MNGGTLNFLALYISSIFQSFWGWRKLPRTESLGASAIVTVDNIGTVIIKTGFWGGASGNWVVGLRVVWGHAVWSVGVLGF